MAGKKNLKDREVWWVDGKGYVAGRVYRNGICRNVRKARWIMEQYLGRKLQPNEVIHHIDGIRTDNRMENLQLLRFGEHSRNHNLNRVYPRGRKNNISPEERIRRSEFMKEVHRRRKLNDPTNSWYARTKV